MISFFRNLLLVICLILVVAFFLANATTESIVRMPYPFTGTFVHLSPGVISLISFASGFFVAGLYFGFKLMMKKIEIMKLKRKIKKLTPIETQDEEDLPRIQPALE